MVSLGGLEVYDQLELCLVVGGRSVERKSHEPAVMRIVTTSDNHSTPLRSQSVQLLKQLLCSSQIDPIETLGEA